MPARADGFGSLPRYQHLDPHRSTESMPAANLMPRWRNWYTRTFEGRMRQLIRVQVPAWAPHLIDMQKPRIVRGFFVAVHKGVLSCVTHRNRCSPSTAGGAGGVCDGSAPHGSSRCRDG